MRNERFSNRGRPWLGLLAVGAVGFSLCLFGASAGEQEKSEVAKPAPAGDKAAVRSTTADRPRPGKVVKGGEAAAPVPHRLASRPAYEIGRVHAVDAPEVEPGGAARDGQEAYILDDGSLESGVGCGTAGCDMFVANQFNVLPGYEVINRVDITFGQIDPPNVPVVIMVLDDPDQDGTPNDATIISTVNGFAEGGGFGTHWEKFAVPDVKIGPEGTSFFVAYYVANQPGDTPYPAGLDTTPPDQGRSWFFGGLPADLPAGGWILTFDLCGAGNCPGNWTLRADAVSNSCGNGVCEGAEDCCACPADCSDCSCGNGQCDTCAGETCVNCAVDCGVGDEPVCACSEEDLGQGNCCEAHPNAACYEDDKGPNFACCNAMCAIDPWCCGSFDGTWDANCAATAATLPECVCCDPSAPLELCGNGVCNKGNSSMGTCETCYNCPEDCAAGGGWDDCPPNDFCVDAPIITLQSGVTEKFIGNNAAATDTECDGNYTSGQGEVWISFELPGPSQWTVHMDYCQTDPPFGDGTGYTQLAFDCACSELTDPADVACREQTECDDEPGSPQACADDQNITLEWFVVEPGIYKYAVMRSDENGAAGKYVISVTATRIKPQDCMETNLTVAVEIFDPYWPGGLTTTLDMSGRTWVLRQPAPYADGVDIPTEIVEMNIQGTDPDLGLVTIRESDEFASTGLITNVVTDGAGVLTSGDASFGPFVEIVVPPPNALTLKNKVPHNLFAVIEGLPPYGAIYNSVDQDLKVYKIDPEMPFGEPDPETPFLTRSEIVIQDDDLITDLDVDLLISHPNRGDLEITLTHKQSGQAVVLANWPGAPAVWQNIGDPVTGQKVILNDAGAGGPFDAVVVHDPTSPPDYQPTGLLSTFDGKNKLGTWSLTIQDKNTDGDGVQGILHNWSLHFRNATPGTPLHADICTGDVCVVRDTNEYVLDDGTSENGIGFGAGGGSFLWLNQFNVISGAEIITDVNVTWGAMLSNGIPAEVVVYSDPNQDGDPNDGVLLAIASVISDNFNDDNFTKYPLDTPVFVGPSGTSFFVGAHIDHADAEYPASIDQTAPDQGRSWGGDGPPTSPPATMVLTQDICGPGECPGNWMVRANACAADCEKMEVGRITSVIHEVKGECLCVKDFTVTAPGTWVGDTTGERNDCDLDASEDHSYTITIPTDGQWTFTTCNPDPLAYDGIIHVGTACCTNDVGTDDDGCGESGGMSTLTVCITAGEYWVTVEGWQGDVGPYELTVFTTGACDVVCVDNENEPDCASVNGGCNTDPVNPPTSPIACGQSYCGLASWDGATRDTDWYELVVTERQLVTMTIEAEFTVVMGLVDTGGSGNCPDNGAISPFTVVDPCTVGTVTAALNPGTWWIFVAPDFDANCDFPCDRQYNLTVDCAPITKDCPANSIFSQPKYWPTDPWVAGTSDLPGNVIRYESYSVAEPICDIHFWGFDLFFDETDPQNPVWVECTENMDFEITFYPDDGTGQPDTANPDKSYTMKIPAMPKDPPLLYGTFELSSYDAVLDTPNCVSLLDGWVSIQGISVGTPDCYFLWMGSGKGDGSHCADEGEGAGIECGAPSNDYDLGLCLTPEGVGGCVTDPDCYDGDECTINTCNAGTCESTPSVHLYPDISPPPSNPAATFPCDAEERARMGDGFLTMLDVMCAFNAMNAGSPYTACPCLDVSPCGGDGFVTMLDVMYIFNSMNVPPGACGNPC